MLQTKHSLLISGASCAAKSKNRKQTNVKKRKAMSYTPGCSISCLSVFVTSDDQEVSNVIPFTPSERPRKDLTTSAFPQIHKSKYSLYGFFCGTQQ